jgi:hypothetical protein
MLLAALGKGPSIFALGKAPSIFEDLNLIWR